MAESSARQQSIFVEDLVKFGRVVSEIRARTYKPPKRHTVIIIRRTPPVPAEGEVMTTQAADVAVTWRLRVLCGLRLILLWLRPLRHSLCLRGRRIPLLLSLR